MTTDLNIEGLDVTAEPVEVFDGERTPLPARGVLGPILKEKDTHALRLVCSHLHAANIADMFEQLSGDEKMCFIDIAADILSAEVLVRLQDDLKKQVLPLLPREQVANVVQTLASDDVVQVFEDLNEEQRAEILQCVPQSARAEIEASLTFAEETAGRLMQREFVAAPAFWTVGRTLEHMRSLDAEQGDNLPQLFFDLYVIDAKFKPIGSVSLSRLMRSAPNKKISDLMSENFVKIPQAMDQEDIAYNFTQYGLISAPVIDENERLVGMITVDDMMGVIQTENKEDMLALTGVRDAGLADTAVHVVRARAPWLFVNLLTAVLASMVIAQFEDVIAQFIALAILMPIVASMGGNAGTQTFAVIVQALAERDLTVMNAMRIVRRELFAGLLIGLLFAGVLGAIAGLWFQSWPLVIMIVLAMTVTHICAGLAGVLVPLGLKRMGIDPAVSSAVFITTITDIVGFSSFLGLGVLILL